jgi:hypothetical protein
VGRELALDVDDDRLEQGGFGGEVVVERALGETGGTGEVIDAGGGVAPDLEELAGGRDEARPAGASALLVGADDDPSSIPVVGMLG